MVYFCGSEDAQGGCPVCGVLALLFFAVFILCVRILREVVSHILNDMPPDPTDVEDLIHAALMSGQPGEALQHAHELDVWLAAHFADIMEATELSDGDIDYE